MPIPDLKQRYQSVKPKLESSLIKEVLCRKKRYLTNEFSKDNESSTISMKLSDDEILGKVSQDERLLIDFIICCLQLKPW